MNAARSGVGQGAALLELGQTIVMAFVVALGACKPTLVVGEYQCPGRSAEAGSPPSETDPIAVPWSTGFENQLDCDYREAGGSCYGFPPGLFRVVSSPVHTGQFAAEFTVLTGTDGGAIPQGRCARAGVFPTEAYYGAWYYIAESATNAGLWDLMLFQGKSDRLWDVQLINGTPGTLNLHLYSILSGKAVGDGPPLPIGAWVHIEFYWKRAKDTSGAVALYQDGVRVVDAPNIVSDGPGTGQGQWYVGNLANSLQPPQATVYVDDITIRATR